MPDNQTSFVLERTETKDKVEKESIDRGFKYYEDNVGGEADFLTFEFEGIAIYNPYTSEDGMEDVDPVKYYGKAYVDWYNLLT